MLKKFLFAILIIILSFLLYWVFYGRYLTKAPVLDLAYKKNILKESGNIFYSLENLRPLVGPEELVKLIEANDVNAQSYTPGNENIINGKYIANLHMHTIYSDGKSSVEYLLDTAQAYAEKYLNGENFYMAITDHNTILGTKELIRVLQKNARKYKNIKVVAGIEIFSSYKTSSISKRPVEIHVLTLAVNPYDRFLNKEFYKKDLSNIYNRKRPDHDFDKLISDMENYGVVGIAHPLRYTTFLGDDKYAYMDELLTRFKNQTKGPVFVEGYYQVYPLLPEKKILGDEFDRYYNFVIRKADNLGIYRTGSTDVHGLSIFTK